MTDISERFGRKAAIYDAYASVQREAGAELLKLLDGAFPQRHYEKAADLGSGTGNLIEGLSLRAGRVLAVDISEEMLDVLSGRHAFAETAVADFDDPSFFFCLGGCDLAASCFALQWSSCIENFLQRMGREFSGNGRTAALAFPVSGTLIELKKAFSDAGADHFINDFPDANKVFDAARSAFSKINLFTVRTHQAYFPDFLSLLHSVTKIGASSLMSKTGPKLSKSVLTAAAQSDVWKEDSQNKFCASYEVAYIIAQ